MVLNGIGIWAAFFISWFMAMKLFMVMSNGIDEGIRDYLKSG